MLQETGLQARLTQLGAELIEARSRREQAAGEVLALRYVNASLRAQNDEVMRTWAPPTSTPGLGRGRKRVVKKVQRKRHHERHRRGADATAPAWIDHGVTPPLRLPPHPAAMAVYLVDALGHAVYEAGPGNG